MCESPDAGEKLEDVLVSFVRSAASSSITSAAPQICCGFVDSGWQTEHWSNKDSRKPRGLPTELVGVTMAAQSRPASDAMSAVDSTSENTDSSSGDEQLLRVEQSLKLDFLAGQISHSTFNDLAAGLQERGKEWLRLV
jgi:hypothetical protein